MNGRACDQCEWGRHEPPTPSLLVCREGPVPVQVAGFHWCSRFRIAERLLGGQHKAARA